MSTPPSTRAAFSAGVRCAADQALGKLQAAGADVREGSRLREALDAAELSALSWVHDPLPGAGTGFASVVGERFYFDDAEACGGYFAAYPEDRHERAPGLEPVTLQFTGEGTVVAHQSGTWVGTTRLRALAHPEGTAAISASPAEVRQLAQQLLEVQSELAKAKSTLRQAALSMFRAGLGQEDDGDSPNHVRLERWMAEALGA